MIYHTLLDRDVVVKIPKSGATKHICKKSNHVHLERKFRTSESSQVILPMPTESGCLVRMLIDADPTGASVQLVPWTRLHKSSCAVKVAFTAKMKKCLKLRNPQTTYKMLNPPKNIGKTQLDSIWMLFGIVTYSMFCLVEEKAMPFFLPGRS